MNNKYLLAILSVTFLCAGSTIAKAETIVTDSKILTVTVYPGSARVTRQALVQLTPGTHSIVFDGIVPIFDDSSMSISGEGTARVKILGGYLKQEYLKEAADKRVKELQDKLEEVSDKLMGEQSHEQAIADQKEFLNSLKMYTAGQLPKDLVTKMPTTIELGDMMKFIGMTREGLEVASEEIRQKKRSLNLDLQKFQSELAQLNSGGAKLKRSIIVDVECTQSGSFTVNAAYTLNGAFWNAIYDAHSLMEKNEVELVSSGNVRQTTGEDWKDVQLTLSTAQPAIGGRMPYVAPWVLSENVVYPQSRGVASMMKVAAMSAGVSDMAVQSEAFDGTSAPAIEAAQMNYAQAAF